MADRLLAIFRPTPLLAQSTMLPYRDNPKKVDVTLTMYKAKIYVKMPICHRIGITILSKQVILK